MAKLTELREDERVLSVFMNHFRVVDIIRESGLSKSTVYRLMSDGIFQQRLREARSAILKEAVEKLRQNLLKNTVELQKIIEDPETSRQIKINAMTLQSAQFRDWCPLVDLDDRITALESSRNT